MTVYEDATAAHQIRIKGDLDANTITVTCSCLIRPGGSYTPLIEPSALNGLPELMAAYREHEKKVSG